MMPEVGWANALTDLWHQSRQICGKHLRPPIIVAMLLWITDALIVGVALVVLAIALTGGADLDAGGVTIRAHSVGNPIAALLALLAIRYLARFRRPFLGREQWSLARIDQQAIDLVGRVRSGLVRFGAEDTRVRRFLLWTMAAALLFKIGAAVIHPGFFSGDDVEIHEMTFARLFDREWPIWDLRSAFYPMTFIYPAQRLLLFAGIDGPGALVLAGRLVVAVISTLSIPLLFFAARRLYPAPVALIATCVFAVSFLHIGFGSTELPRPVATAFVLGGYACLLDARWSRAALAGALFGIAAALRFSEVVFLLPAVVHLAAERRIGRAAMAVGAAAATAAAIQIVSDQLFWGTPLHSLRAFADFTLVAGLSSRGYEPWHFYLSNPVAWTTVPVFVLAIAATSRANWRVAIWFWLPLVVLSCLPHKEPRYLIPASPFFALLAAIGLWRAIELVSAPAAPGDRVRPAPAAALLAVALLATLPLAALQEVSRYDLGRSDADVRLAREVVAGRPRGVAVEQLWRWGGRVYLRDVDVVHDVAPGSPAPADDPGVTLVALRRETCARLDCDAALAAAGFAERRTPAAAASGYRVFGR